MDIILRVANKSDIEAIALLHAEISKQHDQLDPIYSVGAWNDEEYKVDLEKKMEDPRFHVVVAIRGDEIAGFVLVGKRNAIEGHIWEIYVVPTERGKELGKQFSLEAITWFKGENIKTITLYVDIRNEASIKLWESLGFNEYMKKMKLEI